MSLPDVDTVHKRQKLCENATQRALCECLDVVQSCQNTIGSGSDVQFHASLSACDQHLKAKKLSKAVATSTFQYHDAIKAVGKVLCRFMRFR